MKWFLRCLLLLAANVSRAQDVLKIQPGATLKTSGGVIVTLNNMDLVNDGTLMQGPGEGSFRFAGANNNSISGSNPTLINMLNIAKTGSGRLFLERDISIGTSIDFTSGLIDLNSRHIFLNPVATLNNETDASRVTGGAGFIEIIQNLSSPSSVNPGNLGLSLSSAANLGQTVIRRGHASQVGGAGTGNSILRYFDITPQQNSALNATLRFHYFDAELNSLFENGLVLWKSSSLSNWSNEGFTTRDLSDNYVEKTGIAHFSRWTLSSLNNPLPVRFLMVNLRCETAANRIAISWKTGQESRRDRYEIQRSLNGVSWTTIGMVQPNGGPGPQQEYNFSDNSPLPSGSMYRIASVDVDGSIRYTAIVRSDCGAQEFIRAWPNPAPDQLFVSIGASRRSRVLINIYDNKGALVKRQQGNLLPGANQIAIDMTSFAAGTYQLHIDWNEGLSSKTLTVIK